MKSQGLVGSVYPSRGRLGDHSWRTRGKGVQDPLCVLSVSGLQDVGHHKLYVQTIASYIPIGGKPMNRARQRVVKGFMHLHPINRIMTMEDMRMQFETSGICTSRHQ